MSFASEAAKLLTNKYFLYFIVFLAISNVIGYLVTNKLKAVVFFVLVCILAYNFSKNMTIVLIIAIVTTNLLMVNKSMREGLTNATDDATDGTTAAAEGETDAATDAATDPTAATDATTTAGKMTDKIGDGKIKHKVEDIKNKVEAKKNANTGNGTGAGTTGAAKTTETTAPTEIETFAPAGSGYNGRKRGAIGGPAKAARIDYSTTLEQAYDNLDKMLGSDGLSNLSADTEKLMAQQQKLFGSVEKFLPLIDKAQGMIATLDMDKINSLVGMTDKFSGLIGKGNKGAPVPATEGYTGQKPKPKPMIA